MPEAPTGHGTMGMFQGVFQVAHTSDVCTSTDKGLTDALLRRQRFSPLSSMENTGSVLGAVARSTDAETAKYDHPFLSNSVETEQDSLA